MLKNLICNEKTSLIDAWKIINNNGKNIVFITNENNKLLGVLTDGDIRNYLLSNQDFNIQVSKIMNQNFVYGNKSQDINDILKLFNEQIRIVPLITDNGKLVDYIEYSKAINIPVAMPDLMGKEFEYVVDAFLSTWISSTGKYIDKFENDFPKYCGVKHGVSVSNGTVALQLALETLGIGKGDEVIVPDLTFAATINAVLHINATPVIVDVDLDSWCINPEEIVKAITPKTKAIIPVHLYGQVCDMQTIMEIAKKNKLYVVEDCAEAHGAEYNGQKVGSFGDIGCFSFFGNKVITTGEGGMCITQNSDYDDKMRIIRDHGMNKEKRYWHDYIGYNYRMTNLQAAIGVAQVERIDEILEGRHSIERLYKEGLENLSKLNFQYNNLSNRKRVTWFVSILVEKNRDLIIDKLKNNGIDARPFFYPLSRMPIYKSYVFSNGNSNFISDMGINLPTNNKINKEVIKKINLIIGKILNN